MRVHVLADSYLTSADRQAALTGLVEPGRIGDEQITIADLIRAPILIREGRSRDSDRPRGARG